MKKVLLLSPPYLPKYMRNARCDFVSLSDTQWFPIWLGYAGSLFEKKGYKVKLVDAPSYGFSHKETENIFLDYKPDLLVVYTGDKSEDNDVQFADSLLDSYVCDAAFVGPYYSISPKNTLAKSKNVIYGIEGEFEYPILEILQEKSLTDIKNLFWKDNDQIIENEKKPYLSGKELDDFPFVSDFFNRHLDFKYYRTPSEYHPFVDIMTGRGCCWGVCTYCLWVYTFIKGRTYNTRSIENVINEFNFIEKELPFIKSVMIQDDTFSFQRAREFSELKLKKGIKIPWSCYARAEIDFETLKLMKKAGCRNLHVGYESANNMILKRIGKGLTKEQMIKFTKDAKRAGLRIHGDFAIGFPGETRETVMETINWAYKIRPHTAQFQIMIPFKGTPFHKELHKNKWLKDGAPNYPNLSKEEMERLAKKAYRRFYLSFPYMLQSIRYPREHIFNHLKIIKRAIPSMFWSKWDVR